VSTSGLPMFGDDRPQRLRDCSLAVTGTGQPQPEESNNVDM
jgi:hypothetical protein